MSDPLVSYLLFTYNQESYIADALSSAINQDYENYEILVIDDSSKDNTLAIIERIIREANFYDIKVIRRDKNCGAISNFNKLMKMCRGKFIVLAAGDDISYLNRISRLVSIWNDNKQKAISIFTNAKVIGPDGCEVGLYYSAVDCAKSFDDFINYKRVYVGGFSQGFSRELYDKYGDIPTVTFQEDAILSFRAILEDGVVYSNECSVCYRQHDTNTYSVKKYSSYKKIYYGRYAVLLCRVKDLLRKKCKIKFKLIGIWVLLSQIFREVIFLMPGALRLRYYMAYGK